MDLTVEDTVTKSEDLWKLPVGSLLEAYGDHDTWVGVAFKITPLYWTLTGYGDTIDVEELLRFAPAWRILRVGEAID